MSLLPLPSTGGPVPEAATPEHADTARMVTLDTPQTIDAEKVFARAVNYKAGPTFDPVAFGAPADGVADDFAALDACLDAIRALDIDPLTSRGATMRLPRLLRLSATARINRGLIVVGDSGGQFGGTLILPDAGVTPFQIDAPATSPDGGRGAWSTLRDFVIWPNAAWVGTAHGIFAKAPFRGKNLYVRNMSGDGIHIVAANTDVPSTNANNWSLDNVELVSNQGNGLFIDGGDTNQGSAIHVSAIDNGGWGIWDSSSLGSQFFAPHTASNTLGGYNFDSSSNDSVIIGPYAEADQPPSFFGAGVLAFGAPGGAGIDPACGGAWVRGGITGVNWVTGVATSRIHSVKAAADAAERWRQLANGTMDWGDGTVSGGDTRLERKLANVLGVGADDCFRTGLNTTANRPAAATVGEGSVFYDKTLHKPIWSDGANWRDATGAVV